MGILCTLLFVYNLILLVRILSSWFPMPTSGPLRQIMGLVYDVTEPVLRLARGLLPPLTFGGMGFDLSPIIVFIVLGILRASIC